MLVVALVEIFIAIIIALLYTAYAMRFERRRLELTGARRPSRREAELVDPIVDACVTRLGLAHRPVLLIRDDSDPGAMGHTRHIVVSTGLLQEFDFDPEPIGAVLGHELVHVANGDAVAHVFVKGLAWPLYLSYSVLSAIPRLVGHTFMKVLVWLFFWPIMFSVQGVLMPIQSADFRRSEYRADMGAILAGHRRGIRMLLGRMKAIDASPSGWDAAICRTSPPSELRLERLEEPDTPYGLPDRSLRDDSLPDHSRLDHSHPRPAAIGAVGVPLAQD
jgi:Zn-dependent protease with chaperone function